MSENEPVRYETIAKQLLKQISDFRTEVMKETTVSTRAQELTYELLD